MNKREADYGGASTNWDMMAVARKKKRKSRWGNDEEAEKASIPGMPTAIPAGLTKDQEEMYIVQLQIEEISRRLRTGDLGISSNLDERSPSPEPIYNTEGKRLNTREYRTRKKLEEERHNHIQRAMRINKDFKPPADYKPPIIRVNDKVMIPQEEHPDINFVGLLIGPRGNTLKNLEKDTGAKIIIRGKGSVKEGKIGRKDGQPLPGEDEPLHAYVTANNPENVQKAVHKIRDIIRQGIEVPEGQNDLRRQQLRELALLNGTLRENDALSKLKTIQAAQTIVTNTIICTLCGGTGHIAQDCKERRPGDSFRTMQYQSAAEKAKMDSEYMSLMAELGEGPPLAKPVPPPMPHQRPHMQHHGQPPRPPMNPNAPPHHMPGPPPWHHGGPPHPHQSPHAPPRGPPGMMNQGPPGMPPSMAQPSGGPVPPPWQSPGGPPQHNNHAPPRMLAPPPPPPSSQTAPPNNQGNHPWGQSQNQSVGMVPPPPPNNSVPPPPWQTGGVGPVPPPPPGSLPPWQQSSPAPVAPPPPPPSGGQPGGGYAPPPPPPNGAGDASSMSMPGIPLGYPPPPPPN